MSTDSMQVTGRIETNEYSADQLPDEWDSMDDADKLSHLRSIDPIASHTDYNTTVFGMHEYFAINLDATQTLDQDASHLAVGDDSTAPDSSNSSLNNEVFRKSVTDHSQVDNELTASTFIESGEANGQTFREVGLFAGPDPSDRMWNHSTIAAIEKDNTRTITIDVTLSFSAA